MVASLPRSPSISLGASIAVVGDVVDHRREQRLVDALDFVANFHVVQIQVLGTDERNVVGPTVPYTAQQPGVNCIRPRV